MSRRARAAWALVAIIVLALVGQLTVGHENDFGFACFIVFALAVVTLVVMGISALVQRRRAA
jgi:uncharacterized membrane protein